MARKHNVDEVVRSLRKKNDVQIDTNTKTVSIIVSRVYIPALMKTINNPKYTGDLGNGSWGKIDFLTKYCGYSLIRVTE